jgi:hypothetical protein
MPPHLLTLALTGDGMRGRQVNDAIAARGADRAWFVPRFSARCAELGTVVATGPRGPVIAIAAAPPAALQPPAMTAGESAMATPASAGSIDDDQAPAR